MVQHRASTWRHCHAHPGRRPSPSNPERAAPARADPSSRLDPSSRTLRSRHPKTRPPARSGLDQSTREIHNRRNCSVNRNRQCLKVVDRFRRPQKRQDASDFALAYSLRLRSCRLMGAFVISPLPPLLSETLRTAGSLGSTGVTPLRSYCKPHRHPLVFDRLPGVSGYTAYLATADFATGRGGLLQLRDTSSVTVLPLSPRRSDGPSQPDYDPSCCLRPRIASSTSRVKFRGHIRVRLHYGPVTRCHPEDGLVDGLQRFGFPPPCHPSYKALALTLAGLTPAERVRLRWTHNATFRSQPHVLVLPFNYGAHSWSNLSTTLRH